jgi:diguanylate cyclase (GGDEF)-like protein
MAFWHPVTRLLNAVEDRLTVRQQIAFGTAVLCLVLVGAVAGGAAWISREQTTRLVGTEMESLAGFASQRLDAAMASRLRELQFLTTAEPMLARWRADTPAVRRLVDQIGRSRADFSWVGFVRPDGVIRAASNGEREGQSVANRDWFRRGLREPTLIDAFSALPAEEETPQQRALDPFDLIRIAYPVRDSNGLLIGVLGVQLSRNWADDIIGPALLKETAAEQATIWVLGKDGAVVSGAGMGTRPYSEAQVREMRIRESGSFLDDLLPGPSLTGFAVAKGFQSYDGLGWIIVARRSLLVASRAWQSLVNSILTLGGGLAVLGVLMAAVLSGRVAKPLLGLIAEADRIGRDPSATMIGRHSGSREVVDLSASLRSLLRRLGTAEERTLLVQRHAAEQTRRLTEDVHLLRDLASVDPMTGLSNRRAFAAASADAMAEFEADGTSVAILVIDIDHFKRVNDTHGHAAGDTVLRAVAAALKTMAGPSDTVSRYGGEEFVMLMQDVGRAELRARAELIRTSLAALPVPCGEAELRVTVSIGITVAHEADRDFEDLFQRADLALYTAKRGGRNQVQEAMPEAGAFTEAA